MDADAGEPLFAGRRREAHDLGGALTTTGGASCSFSFSFSLSSTTPSAGDGFPAAPEIDTDVLVDDGDPGTVEHAGVISASVVVDEGISSTCSGEESCNSGSFAADSRSAGNSFGGTEAGEGAREGGGEGGGVGSSIAFSTTFCGGRAREDMMIPGAWEGSCGLRDHIAQPPFDDDDDDFRGAVVEERLGDEGDKAVDEEF